MGSGGGIGSPDLIAICWCCAYSKKSVLGTKNPFDCLFLEKRVLEVFANIYVSTIRSYHVICYPKYNI